MRCLLILLGLLASAFAGKPNVIVMLADDMGSNDLGYVNDEVLTPVIDQLAASGVKLSNSYTMNVCTPTRHCVMTGRYPFKTMMAHLVIFPTQQLCTPTDIKMLPQYMKDEGYNTFMSGKWHLGFCREECIPTSRGFDNFYGFYQGEEDYYKHTTGVSPNVGYDWRDGTEIDWGNQGTFNMYLMNDWIVDKIKNYNDDAPFFWYIAWSAPHTPYDCPDKYSDLYPDITGDRQKYLGLISVLDEAIGNVTQTLKDAGFYDNTLIIFSSDNGGEHGYAASNGKLRGSKGSMFEGGLKALGFVRGPMLTKTGYTHDGLFHVTDWVPTIMGIIGAENFDPTSNNIDGLDQSDMILNGGATVRKDIVYNIDMEPMSMMGQTAVRVGDYKFLWGGYGATDGYYEPRNLTLFYADPAVRTAAGLGPYTGTTNGFNFSAANEDDMTTILKLWEWETSDKSIGLDFLFNIKDDPYELTNLVDDPDYADTVKAMKAYVLKNYQDYVETAPAAQQINSTGNPINFNLTWSTGWCTNDLNMP